MSRARSQVTADDGRVRVTTWTFDAAGDATGQHVHEFDYVVVPVTGGTFVVTRPDGAVDEMTQYPGSPYLGTAGTAHDVASREAGPAVFVEIELTMPVGP